MSQIKTLAAATGNEIHEARQVVNVEPLEGTPFHLVQANELYFLSLGKYRITPNYNTAEEAKAHLENDFWKVLMDVCICLIESNKMYHSLNQEQLAEIHKNAYE